MTTAVNVYAGSPGTPSHSTTSPASRSHSPTELTERWGERPKARASDSVESKRLAAGHERREPLNPGVDQRLVDEAERQAHVVTAAPVREERRTGNDADAALHGSSREIAGIRTLRQRQP